MPTFTLTLAETIEATGGVVDFGSQPTTMVGGNIGLGVYPIFNESYRAGLTGKIIDHFYNREIGLETVDMFQLAMRRKMNEIMPYYNKLYESERISYDPLSTVDLRTINSGNATQESNSTADSTATSEANAKSRSVNSETPQTMLAGNGDYATSAADANSDSINDSIAKQINSDNATTASNNETLTKGYQGAASDIIMRYRDSLLNIDMNIIRDLEECFMGVWDNGDSFTHRETLSNYTLPYLN